MKLKLEAFNKTLGSLKLCRGIHGSVPSFAHGNSRESASGRSADANEEEREGGGPCWDRKEGLYLEGGANAYEVLGVSSSCSQEHLRDAFTKLAKSTHPDLQPGPSTSAQFILVFSAYRILSSPTRRAQYDAYLQACSEKIKEMHGIGSEDHVTKDEDAVEWLRWYRRMTMNMVYEREIGVGGIFHDKFRACLQEAMQKAYFGPNLDNYNSVYPSCFEAEERAEAEETDVLHLVSGRKCFGAVRHVCPTARLEESKLKLEPSAQSQLFQSSILSLRKTLHRSFCNELQQTHATTEGQERGSGAHGRQNCWPQYD